MLEVLQPVMHNLASPSTGLARFINALGATAAEVAPVAEIQAQAFGSLDTTFTALAEVARPFIQESISEGPPTEETAIRTLPQIRTLLANSTELFRDLEPAAVALQQDSPTIAARARGRDADPRQVRPAQQAAAADRSNRSAPEQEHRRARRDHRARRWRPTSSGRR